MADSIRFVWMRTQCNYLISGNESVKDFLYSQNQLNIYLIIHFKKITDNIFQTFRGENVKMTGIPEEAEEDLNKYVSIHTNEFSKIEQQFLIDRVPF